MYDMKIITDKSAKGITIPSNELVEMKIGQSPVRILFAHNIEACTAFKVKGEWHVALKVDEITALSNEQINNRLFSGRG